MKNDTMNWQDLTSSKYLWQVQNGKRYPLLPGPVALLLSSKDLSYWGKRGGAILGTKPIKSATQVWLTLSSKQSWFYSVH